MTLCPSCSERMYGTDGSPSCLACALQDRDGYDNAIAALIREVEDIPSCDCADCRRPLHDALADVQDLRAKLGIKL